MNNRIIKKQEKTAKIIERICTIDKYTKSTKISCIHHFIQQTRPKHQKAHTYMWTKSNPTIKYQQTEPLIPT